MRDWVLPAAISITGSETPHPSLRMNPDRLTRPEILNTENVDIGQSHQQLADANRVSLQQGSSKLDRVEHRQIGRTSVTSREPLHTPLTSEAPLGPTGSPNRLLDRLEVIGADQNCHRATIAGHHHAFLCGDDLVDDFREPSFDFG